MHRNTITIMLLLGAGLIGAGLYLATKGLPSSPHPAFAVQSHHDPEVAFDYPEGWTLATGGPHGELLDLTSPDFKAGTVSQGQLQSFIEWPAAGAEFSIVRDGVSASATNEKLIGTSKSYDNSASYHFVKQLTVSGFDAVQILQLNNGAATRTTKFIAPGPATDHSAYNKRQYSIISRYPIQAGVTLDSRREKYIDQYNRLVESFKLVGPSVN